MSSTRNIHASFKTRNVLFCETEIKQANADSRACCDGLAGAGCCVCGIASLASTAGLATPYALACITLGGLYLSSAYRIQRDGRVAALQGGPLHQTMDPGIQPSAPHYRV